MQQLITSQTPLQLQQCSIAFYLFSRPLQIFGGVQVVHIADRQMQLVVRGEVIEVVIVRHRILDRSVLQMQSREYRA